MRLARLIGPELETLLRESPEEVKELLGEIHPEDVADIIDLLDDKNAAQMLAELPPEYSAQVFERLDEDRQEALTGEMGIEQATVVAAEMDADERADFFSGLPPELSAPLLEKLEEVAPEAAEDVTELTRWPETSAGGLMTTDYVAVPPDIEIREAIERIRAAAEKAETVDTIFVCEGNDQLLGLLTLRDLLLARPTQMVDTVMHQNVISVPPELDQEEVARKLAKYDLSTLPVVSSKGELLGVITSDDILDVMTEEHEEDVQKMAAVEPIEDGYFDTPLFTIIRKRATWLLILFGGSLVTTTTMQQFGTVLQSIATLAFYVPLIIASGGNSGSQSGTLIIRGLAVGDVTTADAWRVLWRELVQGLVLGTMLAVCGLAWVLVSGHDLRMAVVVSGTVVGLVVTGCVVGSAMPLLLSRLGIDPATSSTPLIATLIDTLGVLLYLSLARLVLADLMVAARPG